MIGQTLKNYVIEAKLGQGGMGVVYRARDAKLDRNVAIKVLPPELVRDAARRRRFVQEARAASAVNHPAIASIYEIEDEGETTFIVMEYVDGSTVRQLVERGELDLSSAIEIGIQVADGLARAHEAGVVHRDIKSDNIMVTHDGHPKILDFGLAKLLDKEDGDAGPSRLETVAMTQAGMVVGTVSYMSPEQARGLPADKRSDVFSLGIVLYEMATGRLPFRGQSMLDTMHAIAFDATQPLRTIRADLPFSLQRVVDRCLRKKPEDRYGDLREAVTDLRAVRRELDSGVSGGGAPLFERLRLERFHLDRLRAAAGGLSVPGLLLVGGAILIALIILIPTLQRGNIGGLIPVTILGGIVFAHVRRRHNDMIRRFTRKASKLKEVRLVGFRDGGFIVFADRPTAKTYVKLNALLEAANNGLYQGAPMTMSVREDVSEADVRQAVTQSGIRYLRDA